MREQAPAGAEPRGPFQDEYLRRLDEIESRGRECGLTLTHICREAGVARATPDRWRKRPPLSVALVDRLEAVVTAAEKAAGKA